MSDRRARPTLRALVDDLAIALPDLDEDLGELDHPFLDELRRIAPGAPVGQKRILSITPELVYRIRVSSERGATWVDTSHAIVWLCAVQGRVADSQDDAYEYFESLHASGQLLPSGDDYLRDRAEAAIRLQRGLSAELLDLADGAIAAMGNELYEVLGDWVPCRVIARDSGGIEEIWCALSSRGTDGSNVSERLRDLLFASLEQHLHSEISEPRYDWPDGDLEWFEVVVLNVRQR